MNLTEIDDVIDLYNELPDTEINNVESLAQEYQDICGYSEKDSYFAAERAIEQTLLF